jgi:hypothetical protein
MLTGAMLNGVDVSETPFELTKDVSDLILLYTDRISRVTGRVDADGLDTSVLLFPADGAWADTSPAARRFRQDRAGATGEFTFDAVPPGDYYAIAVPESQATDWRDPAALDALARGATRLSVAEGGTRAVALRVVKDARR